MRLVLFLVLSFFVCRVWACEHPFHTETMLEEYITHQLIAEKALAEDVESQLHFINYDRFKRTLAARETVAGCITALQIQPALSRFQVTLTVGNEKEEGESKTLVVQGYFDELLKLPAFTKRMHRGDIIKQDDLETVGILKKNVKPKIIHSVEALLGKEVLYTIHPHIPISTNDIASPLVIHKKDMVALTYEKGPLHIKAVGTALEEGRIGETIRVKNTHSDSVVIGRVAGMGTVSVNPVP